MTIRWNKKQQSLWILAGMSVGTSAWGQSSNLLHPENYVAPPGTPIVRLTTIDEVSLIKLPVPPTYQLHDLINVTVNETIVNRVNAQLNKRRNNKFEYSLDDFIVILDNLRLRSDTSIQASQPSIDLQALNTEQKQFQFNRNDNLRYSLQCEVVEIKPNGTLLVEANKRVTVNNEVYEYRMSGLVDPRDINPKTRSVLSTNVASAQFDLTVKGAARDSLKRGYISALLDWFQPF